MVDEMVDGLVIMLVGMGVVFVFLTLLMAFIRLICMERKQPAEVADGTGDAVPARSDPERSAHQGALLAAVVAVAMELEGRGAPVPAPEVSAAPSPWRESGRSALHAGPEAIGAIRAGGRGWR